MELTTVPDDADLRCAGECGTEFAEGDRVFAHLVNIRSASGIHSDWIYFCIPCIDGASLMARLDQPATKVAEIREQWERTGKFFVDV